jgi:hypothetical protein
MEGIGALGGGDIVVSAGRNVSDISVIATGSLLTATATGASSSTKALVTLGRGDVSITAGGDLLGGRVDVASGTGLIRATGEVAAAGVIPDQPSLANLLRLHISDATVDVLADKSATLQGVSALGPKGFVSGNGGNSLLLSRNLNAATLYSTHAALNVLADGPVTMTNLNDGLLTDNGSTGVTGGKNQAVYPGSFTAVSMTNDLDIVTNGPGAGNAALSVLLVPSPQGQLTLLAGGDILPATIAMLDADPGVLPGTFSTFNASFGGGSSLLVSGIPLAFPIVQPSTTDAQRRQQHNESATHAGDPDPVRIVAGNDIGAGNSGLILSVPKQARVTAGRDILNMMFFGQNLSADDITRIVAGRDITATTLLTTPTVSVSGNGVPVSGMPEPALQGNSFVVGGPGTFMIEAGRDLGPFLNSATITSFSLTNSGPQSIVQTYGGGILAVGNDWNPWLPAKSADIDVMFGVAKGIDYDGFRDRYLDPAGLASLPAYLVMLTSGDTESIYEPDLITWLQQRAAGALTAAYGTTDVSYAQAYAIFNTLPELQQRIFLDQIYFNELKQTSVKDGVSYLQYARGYQAVNTLFPASIGYTANDLSGGSNGANTPVETGNLDLRLATIQTEFGGDIDIFGPGGRVIAGSTVRTDAQAERRSFDGQRLFGGFLTPSNDPIIQAPAAIGAIPTGYEGVLTLRGGNINTFTDGDFLLNQSRLFTEGGGEITMWSSNADLNAGQGPKTSSNFPPVVVTVDQNLFVQTDKSGATTGAGIAALQATPDAPPSDVFLIAPRGTVDAGAAGVRVSGDLSVAALHVANTANFQVQGTTTGTPTAPAVNIGALTTASNTAGAAAAAATDAAGKGGRGNAQQDLPSIITVEVIGYGGGDGRSDQDLRDEDRRKRFGQQTNNGRQDPNSPVQVIGGGILTPGQQQKLTATEIKNFNEP